MVCGGGTARYWYRLVPGSAANDGALLFQVSGHSAPQDTHTASASSAPLTFPSLGFLPLPLHCLW